MRRLLAALGALTWLLIAPAVALAQAGTPAQALTTCGSPNNSPVNGSYYSLTTSLASRLCVDSSGSVQPAPAGATSTDASGTVTLGGTYQTAIAASSIRKGCLIQNPTTATEVLSVKVGTMAAPFTILAGGTFSCASGSIVVTDAITITAPTTGHAFSAVYQ